MPLNARGWECRQGPQKSSRLGGLYQSGSLFKLAVHQPGSHSRKPVWCRCCVALKWQRIPFLESSPAKWPGTDAQQCLLQGVRPRACLGWRQQLPRGPPECSERLPSGWHARGSAYEAGAFNWGAFAWAASPHPLQNFHNQIIAKAFRVTQEPTKSGPPSLHPTLSSYGPTYRASNSTHHL